MRKHKFIISLLIITGICSSCRDFDFFSKNPYHYTGDVDPAKYNRLKEKKIFIDPAMDQSGDMAAAYNEMNLRVSLILGDMLERAGALVLYGRVNDKEAGLKKKLEKITGFRPDLLIILRNNYAIKKTSGESSPVLVWGNKKVNPLSYDFADILLDEFRRISDGKVPAFPAEYKETGASILRETRNICPGAICDFSDEMYAGDLHDMEYSQEKAETCFFAISRFFERGIPEAQVLISSYVDNSFRTHLIKDNDPVIAIKIESDLEKAGLIRGSINASLDDVPVKCRTVSDDLFFVDYGKILYPGAHCIRFSFKNQRNQSSMIFRTEFSVETEKGDFERLLSDGEKLLGTANTKEGLKMLLSALSMGRTDADRIIFNIARGFEVLGDKANSGYYYSKLYNFYPQSKYIKKINRISGSKRTTGSPGSLGSGFFERDYDGKQVEIRYEPSLEDLSKK